MRIIHCLFQHLKEKAKSITGIHQWPYQAVANALEVIPRTLVQNCGANPVRTLTPLRVGITVFQWFVTIVYIFFNWPVVKVSFSQTGKKSMWAREVANKGIPVNYGILCRYWHSWGFGIKKGKNFKINKISQSGNFCPIISNFSRLVFILFFFRRAILKVPVL